MDLNDEAYFQGDGYVEVDKSLMPHTSPMGTETIIMDFSTLDENGILLWHGQKSDTDGRGQDFVALAGS